MAYPYALADRIGTRATLGLIVLQPDETIEHDFRRLLPVDDVTLYVSRIPSGTEVSGDTLALMRDDLPEAARLFPPALDFDVVGYGCTSGTSVIGADVVADLVRGACRVGVVTEPVTSLVAACAALGASRIGFLSPYVAEVSASLRDTLQLAGIAAPVFGSFDEAVETRVARIAPRSIVDAAVQLAQQGGIDALFLSCTNLRTLDVIADIEAQTGLPVLSSNLVLAWDMARKSGIRLHGDWGKLSRV